METDPWNVLRVVLASTLIEVIGFGALIPIIPLLLTEPGSTFFMLPAGVSVETGYILMGLLIAAYPFMQFFSTPILGQLSDRYGRRTVLQVSILGTVVAQFVFGIGVLIGNVPLLFVSRALDGLTGGSIAVVQAAIADVSSPGERPKHFGLLSASFGVGFIIGPFLGGVLSSPGIHPWFVASTPFFAGSLLSILSLLIVNRFLPETGPLEAARINWRQPVENVVYAFGEPGRRLLFGTTFFFFAGFTFFTTFASVYLIKRFGFGQFEIGNFFLYIGILVILTQTVIVPRFYDRFNVSRTMPVTLFLTGLFIGLLYLPHDVLLMLAIIPFFAVSNGLTQVAVTTLVSNSASHRDQGLVLGVNASLRALASAIPAVLSGVAAALIAPEAPVLVSGSIIMATAVMFVLIRRAKRL